MNKLYPNSSSEGQNDCTFSCYLLHFHGTFYTRLAERGQTETKQVVEAMREAEKT